MCVAPVRMVCGSVRVWLALPLPLPVWKQSLPVLGGAASPPSGSVTMRMTVVMVQMRSARTPALQTSSAVPACQGESKLPLLFQQAQFQCKETRKRNELGVKLSYNKSTIRSYLQA